MTKHHIRNPPSPVNNNDIEENYRTKENNHSLYLKYYSLFLLVF